MSHSLNGMDDGHDNGLVFDQKTLRMRCQTWALIWCGVWERFWLNANSGRRMAARRLWRARGQAGGWCAMHQKPYANGAPLSGRRHNAKYRATANALADGAVVRRDLCNSFAGMTQLAQRVPVELVLTHVTVTGVCAPCGLPVVLRCRGALAAEWQGGPHLAARGRGDRWRRAGTVYYGFPGLLRGPLAGYAF